MSLKRKRTANEIKVEWLNEFVETDTPKSHDKLQIQLKEIFVFNDEKGVICNYCRDGEVAGIAVLTISIWMLMDPTFYLSVAQAESSYYTGIYIFLAAGALMFLVAFLGCCGAYKESPCMLVSFFCFLLIILVAEIAAGAWAYGNRDTLEEYVRESVKATVQQEYGGESKTRTATFDTIQRGLNCCGANGPSDWANSKYNSGGKDGMILTISSIPGIYQIPPSCCRNGEGTSICELGRNIGLAAPITTIIYSEGCIDKLIDTLKNHMNIVLGVGLSVGIVELLGLMFSLILCCAIRSMDQYKA